MRRYVLAGIAAYDGIIAASMIRQNEILLIDARAGKILARAPFSPRALAFDASGRLFVLTENTLTVSTLTGLPDSPKLSEATTLVTGLEDTYGLALDADGNYYISDRGISHQVKIFTPDGKPAGKIGKPGTPTAGPYDPLHINNPSGLAIDNSGNIWVTEKDYQPKRISVWDKGGNLLNAFYGPAEYGGGGTLDPSDKNNFYYRGMEFSLDWESGTDKLANVIYRPASTSGESHTNGFPEQPIAGKNGQKYFTNSYNYNPTNGASMTMLWVMENGIARPCNAAGRAQEWDILKDPAFRSAWPEELDPNGEYDANQSAFIWNDLNSDGEPSPTKYTITKGVISGAIFQPDLSITFARLNRTAVRFSPRRFIEEKTRFSIWLLPRRFSRRSKPRHLRR